MLASQSKAVALGEGYSASIVEEHYNPLIKRRELKVLIIHVGKGTPRRYDVREAVAKALGVDLEKVYVRKLDTEYGAGRTTAIIHVYEDAVEAKRYEPQHIIDRNQPPD